MTRPILLQVEDVSAAADDCARCARLIGAQLAGIEHVLPDVSPFLGLEAASRPSAEPNGGDDRCRIAAIAARCHEVRLDPAVEAVTNLLHRASATGATILNLTFPPMAIAPRTAGFARYQEALNFACQLLRAVRFDAESTGVVVAVEAASGRWLLSPVELRELIDAVNSCAIGACIDLTRVSAVGSPDDWLMTLTHRVKTVRWNAALEHCGGSMDSNAGPVEPIAGTNALATIGFNGPIIIPHDFALAESFRVRPGESGKPPS